jgi:antitoxin (DNA-binding transcriptional repressor) of toxin-antitoxin stability system
MKLAGIREIRAHTAALLGGEEPVLVTRHGKVSGVYVPLSGRERLPNDLHREIARILGHHISVQIDVRGVSEDEIQRDFDAFRRSRR